jgi:glycosyltransferase involved in cell wall biosynthesis
MTPSVWIINPYGSLPSESWSTYRSTMLAEALSEHGYRVTQFISNFEHRSKSFRTAQSYDVESPVRYRIEVIPSTAYRSHISLDRVRYERTFARGLLTSTRSTPAPDFVVLAEPAIFYYDIILRGLLASRSTALVLDVIDLWPELFALVFPRMLRPASGVLLTPLYYWRRRLYRRADGLVAVARDYLERTSKLVPSGIPRDVVYWSFDERRDADDGQGGPSDTRLRALISARQPGETWALYAGTLGENYDIRGIVDASRQLSSASRGPLPVKFIVAGDGPLASYCRAQENETFTFLGRLGAADLGFLYRHGDIALCTYRGESTVAFPIKAFDYLRNGLPIVNSLGRDLGALIREKRVGINYDPRRTGALAAAVESLTSDPILRQQMSDDARRVSAEFSRQKQYERFVRLLEAVGQRRARTQ